MTRTNGSNSSLVQAIVNYRPQGNRRDEDEKTFAVMREAFVAFIADMPPDQRAGFLINALQSMSPLEREKILTMLDYDPKKYHPDNSMEFVNHFMALSQAAKRHPEEAGTFVWAGLGKLLLGVAIVGGIMLVGISLFPSQPSTNIQYQR